MVRWFVYIVFILTLGMRVSSAHAAPYGHFIAFQQRKADADTSSARKKQQEDEKNSKVKEIAKAKRLAKPEKVDDKASPKPKPARERRPEGMERPPEIPRRNGP